jgi:hypothetical protein
MREKRLAEPYKKYYKVMIKGSVAEYCAIREEGKFI